jgi:hypothetical protein
LALLCAATLALGACAATEDGGPGETADRQACRSEAEAARLRADAAEAPNQARSVIARDGRAVSVPTASSAGSGLAAYRDALDRCMKRRAAERGQVKAG